MHAALPVAVRPHGIIKEEAFEKAGRLKAINAKMHDFISTCYLLGNMYASKQGDHHDGVYDAIWTMLRCLVNVYQPRRSGLSYIIVVAMLSNNLES